MVAEIRAGQSWNTLSKADKDRRIAFVLYQWRQIEEWHTYLADHKMNYVESVTLIKLAEYGLLG